MKKYGAILFALLLLCLGGFLFRPKAQRQGQPAQVAKTPRSPLGPSPQTNTESKAEIHTVSQKNWEETWRRLDETPMDLYGIVLDEKDQPIADAIVRISWNPLKGDTNEVMLKSDSNGRFAFTGRKGRYVNVDVKKEGYDVVLGDRSRLPFNFAAIPGQQGYRSNPNRPEVFRLRKQGKGAPLVRGYSIINLPPDGSTIVDLNTGQVSPTGDLEFALKRSRNELPFAWEAQARIETGGFVKAEGQFPFTAPESGYQQELRWSFPLNEQGRQPRTDFEETYYIAFGSPRKYGRLRFWAKADTRVLIVEAFVNPMGDRNLEPAAMENVGAPPTRRESPR